jgi:hypothetical protein
MVDEIYKSFAQLNPDLLADCVWQMRVNPVAAVTPFHLSRVGMESSFRNSIQRAHSNKRAHGTETAYSLQQVLLYLHFCSAILI